MSGEPGADGPWTPQVAADPATAPEVLTAIAAGAPGLWVYLASNPSTHADLLTWLSTREDPRVQQALAQRMPPVLPPAGPVPAEVRAAPPPMPPGAVGPPPPPPPPSDASGPTPVPPAPPPERGRRSGARLFAVVGLVAVLLVAAMVVLALYLRPGSGVPPVAAQQTASDPGSTSDASGDADVTAPGAEADTSAGADTRTDAATDHDAEAAPATETTPTAPPSAQGRAEPTGSVYREALVLRTGADESLTFTALSEAAASGARIRLELAVPDVPDQFLSWDGAVAIGVPPYNQDATWDTHHSGSMGFWIVVDPQDLGEGGSDKAFFRISGTFRVEAVDNGRLEEFHLTSASGPSPTFPPGPSDPDRCASADTDRAVAQAVEALATGSEPYASIRAQWMSSPRVWWAVRAEALDRTAGTSGDRMAFACTPWWGE